jgi:hypothetical protein
VCWNQLRRQQNSLGLLQFILYGSRTPRTYMYCGLGPLFNRGALSLEVAYHAHNTHTRIHAYPKHKSTSNTRV